MPTYRSLFLFRPLTALFIFLVFNIASIIVFDVSVFSVERSKILLAETAITQLEIGSVLNAIVRSH